MALFSEGPFTAELDAGADLCDLQSWGPRGQGGAWCLLPETPGAEEQALVFSGPLRMWLCGGGGGICPEFSEGGGSRRPPGVSQGWC